MNYNLLMILLVIWTSAIWLIVGSNYFWEVKSF